MRGKTAAALTLNFKFYSEGGFVSSSDQLIIDRFIDSFEACRLMREKHFDRVTPALI